jgi:hypothetical protein
MPSRKRIAEDVSHILTLEYLTEACKTKNVKEIATETGCSKSVIYNYLRAFDLKAQAKYVSGADHYNWIGGKYVKTDRGGYMVKVDDPDYKYKYRPEHCVIMEEHIGRKMLPDEVVHHIDGDPFNNDLENLVLLTKEQHDRFHLLLGALQYDHRTLTKDQVLKIIDDSTYTRLVTCLESIIQ